MCFRRLPLVLYCAAMKHDSDLPTRLAGRLRRMGLGEVSATLLEALKPLAVLGSQTAIVLSPLLGGRDGEMQSLARMLEDPEEMADLIKMLREDEGL